MRLSIIQASFRIHKILKEIPYISMTTLVAIFLFVPGCTTKDSYKNSEYGSENLAEQWRSRTAPQYQYPADNDADYYYPGTTHNNRRPPVNPNYKAPPNIPADNDADYYYYPSYPSYDPEADNRVAPPTGQDNEEDYYYPLFFDE